MWKLKMAELAMEYLFLALSDLIVFNVAEEMAAKGM
jgi:hypothetical protein